MRKYFIFWFLPVLLFFWRSQKEASIKDPLELSVTRYRKGLELQRLLFEKLLELDQHFAVSQTDFSIPLSIDGTLISSNQVTGLQPFETLALHLSTNAGQSMDGVECWALIWLNLYNDIRGFLKGAEELHIANSLLEEDCRLLFHSYTSFLGYDRSLTECRSSDDWQSIQVLLDKFEQKCRSDRLAGRHRDADLAHVNLEFAVDRLLDLLSDYRLDIRQGTIHYRYYLQTFSHYSSTSNCTLPDSWIDEIISSIGRSNQKYSAAYDLAELEGSRLKDLLYGFE